jgi:ABC-type uncharacterized transport system involved in gliding motility auxiliary subunit
VAEIDLRESQEVPEDAAVLVLAGPRRPLAEQEIAILSDHLARGGRLLLLIDPDPTADLRQLLDTWSLEVEDGHLVDPISHVVPHEDNILVPKARNALGLPETYFLGATALIPKPGVPPSVEVSALVWSSPESWLETDGADGEPRFDEGEDRGGPLAIGALVRALPEGARLAVIGDSDFATNRHFLNGGNGDLFLNAVSWLAAGQEVIAIDRKVLPVRRLLLSPEEARFLHLSSIGLLPSLLLVTAGIVWWRRRQS